jgi:hypothetical protein
MPKGKGIPGSHREPESSDKAEERGKEQEFATTGGRASEDPLKQFLDEGITAGHAGGQLRGDQTEGHRGGSWRQNKNRGRG